MTTLIQDSTPSNIPCAIYMAAPTNGTALLPSINVKFNGTKTDLIISDSEFSQSEFLEFEQSAQLRITGKTATLSLQNHKVSKLRLKFENVFATLNRLQATNVTLISASGFLNGIVAPSFA